MEMMRNSGLINYFFLFYNSETSMHGLRGSSLVAYIIHTRKEHLMEKVKGIDFYGPISTIHAGTNLHV